MPIEQPLLTATIRRPFHWGIVVIAPDGNAQIPEVASDTLVSSNGQGLVILVRHAQDVESFDGDFDWAEAEITVRLLVEPQAATPDREVFRGVINVPDGRLAVGDADGDVIVPAHHGANLVVVTIEPSQPALSPDVVQVDLLPG
jgi:hypothetical protein